MSAVTLDNIRRYRAIASLCRQTAAFRPEQKLTLLQQAEEWDRLAMDELESLRAPIMPVYQPVEPVMEALEMEAQEAEAQETEENDEQAGEPYIDTRWWLPRREGLFAGLQA